MFDRLGAMAVEVVLSAFQMMLGGAHGFERFVNVRMRFGHGGSRGRTGSNLRRGGHRRRWRLRSGSGRREGEREQQRCGDKQTHEPNLFHTFLLVRLRPGRSRAIAMAAVLFPGCETLPRLRTV